MEEKTTAPVAVKVPDTKELLKNGVQFGHESKRWNPKMAKFIYSQKGGIHILDINQTQKRLEEAAAFLAEAASKGGVMFVGTKRQVSDIIKDEAIRAGAYFINNRWAGGLLTNFSIVKKSLDKLNALEKAFEEGVEDRTKYEVSRMKKEWERLDRLYSGIKGLTDKPTAVVIVDTNYEKSAVRESRKMGIPVVALVDTNSDPDMSDYVIPANDDAIGSVKLIVSTLADAALQGNKGKGIEHKLVDYSKVEIKIKRNTDVSEDEVQQVELANESQSQPEAPRKTKAPARSSKGKVKGILEMAKEDKSKAVVIKKSKSEKSAKEEKAPAKAKLVKAKK